MTNTERIAISFDELEAIPDGSIVQMVDPGDMSDVYVKSARTGGEAGSWFAVGSDHPVDSRLLEGMDASAHGYRIIGTVYAS